MKKVQDYIGRIVRLRSATFRALQKVQSQGPSLDNRFLCSTISRKTRKLVCYGGDLCLLLTPDEIELV